MNLYARWDFAQTLPALGIHGVTSAPRLRFRGSRAEIYSHPLDSSKLIKVTSDRRDVQNLVAAQTIKSTRNVVKVHGQPTTLGVTSGEALVVDFVAGALAPYSSGEVLALLDGKQSSDPRPTAHMRIMRPDEFRLNILRSHGRDCKEEYAKLCRLFWAIYELERDLDIRPVDFDRNMIDDGGACVLVDLGE